jgi:hypothetical protein
MTNVDLNVCVVEQDSYDIKVFSFNDIDEFLIVN